MIKIGIKFCGGCNPRYDRKMVKEKIKKLSHGMYEVSMAKENEFYELLIVISGCRNSCANYLNISYKEIIIIDENIDFTDIEHLFSLKK